MYESSNTTGATAHTAGYTSQLSFYEYPPHKPYINSINQPLRPSHSLSKTVTLPESNRDQLLTSLQSLTLKIKTLENEREKAELSLHDITGGLSRSINRRRRDHEPSVDEQIREAEENFRRLQTQHKRVLDLFNDHHPAKPRTNRKKKKRSSHHNQSLDSATLNAERHYHLDMNDVPFILGQSTSPSHNLKSNVQNVIHLLKNHNHQLCLSSKEYADILHPRHKSEISPHTLLYLDHYNKPSSKRPSSASPVRSTRRPIQTSPTRRPQTASTTTTTTDSQIYSRIKRLRREYVILSREHARLNSSLTSSEDIDIISRRMDIILEELGQLQRQYMSTSQDLMEQDLNETPIETLRRTKLLQLILRDPINKQQKH